MTISLVAITSLHADGANALDKYLSVVGPLMKAAGAEVVSRYELRDCIAGKNEVQFVSVIQYPDEASIKQVFDSDKYKSLEEVKRQAFSKYQVSTGVIN